MSFKRKDLLGMRDLTEEEILYFLDTAESFKEINNRDVKKVPSLKGRTIINAFFENSTRTRVSFEIAGKRLSADVINFSASASSTKKGETLVDTIQNMASMKTDVFVVRHSYSGSVKFIAENTDARVVNAGDGLNEHPSQSLLDLMTIREHKKDLKGLEVAIVGDITHSRVARSNIWAMNTLGMKVRLFGPQTMIPKYIEPFNCTVCNSIEEAVEGVDVAMMLRIQAERQTSPLLPSAREYSTFFGLNKNRVKLMKEDGIIMHPGPINRGVEINSDVVDSGRSVILDQVENGAAVRMGILYLLGLQKGGEQS